MDTFVAKWPSVKKKVNTKALAKRWLQVISAYYYLFRQQLDRFPIVFLNGGPGSGKTSTINMFLDTDKTTI